MLPDLNQTQTNQSNGVQSAIESPQNTNQYNANNNVSSSKIQPVDSQSLLSNSGGISLNNTQVTKVSVPTQGSFISNPKPLSKPTNQHINFGLLFIPIILVVIAAIAIWQIQKTAKNTTEY